MVINLFDHQKDQIEETAQAFLDGSSSLLFQAATGSGKSITSSYMTQGAINKGSSVWFVVPRVDLLKQMSLLFRSLSMRHTFIASGYDHYYDNNLSICMLETLRRNYLDYKKPNLIIIDEAHFSGKAIGELVDFALNNKIKVIGLSATPARNDNTGMGDWFDTMVKGKSISWLIENNYLAQYKLIRPEVLHKKANTGDHVALFKEHLMGRRVITFCRDINHSKAVTKDFVEAGIKAVHIDGTANIFERRDAFIAFAKGEIDTIVNSKLLTFGFDLELATGLKNIPITGMLDIAKCGSLPLQLQKNGRAIRKQDGYSVIVDSAGNTHPAAHGLPCSDRDWKLIKGDVRERDLIVRNRKINSMHCTSCYRPSPFTGSLHCPYCGSVYEIKEYKNIKNVNGVLIEITPEMIEKERAKQEQERKNKKKRRNLLLAKARTFTDLRDIAEEYGYNYGWVKIQARLKNIKS